MTAIPPFGLVRLSREWEKNVNAGEEERIMLTTIVTIRRSSIDEGEAALRAVEYGPF